MANNTVELWLEIDNTNRRALTIPLETCTNFAVFPLTWLCYLGFTICGTEGHISDAPNGQAIADYRPAAPVIQAGIYYYITEAAPRWLDIDMMNVRSSRHWQRADIKQDRDGSCVMTGTPLTVCEACHIIPRCRGDEYIIDLVQQRDGSFLEGINDTRNGLLVCSGFHYSFEQSCVAFLRTPNHAMDVTDVPYVVHPNVGNIGIAARQRLTLQYIDDDSNSLMNLFIPHNSDARISNSTEWPPDLLFDVTYGCAALNQSIFMTAIRDNIDRGRGAGAGRGADRGGDQHGTTARAERAAKRASKKEQARTAGSQPPG